MHENTERPEPTTEDLLAQLRETKARDDATAFRALLAASDDWEAA